MEFLKMMKHLRVILNAPHLVTANPAVTVVTIRDNDGKDLSGAIIVGNEYRKLNGSSSVNEK